MTRVICRHADIGIDKLINDIDDIDHEGTLSDNEISEIISMVIDKVNGQLPGSLQWIPSTSEVISDGEDIEVETVRDLISNAIAEVFGFENGMKSYELIIAYPGGNDSYYSRLAGSFWKSKETTTEAVLEEMKANDPDTFEDIANNPNVIDYWVEKVED